MNFHIHRAIKNKASILLLSGLMTCSTAVFADDASIRADLDEVTTKVLQNKVIWTGDYSGYADSFIDKSYVNDTRDDTWMRLRHRLRLGLRAEPNQFFRFTGRLAAYKNFPVMDSGESLKTPSVYYTGSDTRYYSTRPSSDALFRIDRMYMDFFPSTKALSFSFGIFPSTEGLPTDLQKLQPRKSTYPNLLFSRAFAGVVTAIHPHEVFDFLPETHFWYVYSHAYTPGTSGLGYSYQDATKFAVKNRGHLHMFLLEVDPKVSFAEKLTISGGYAIITDYTVDRDTYDLVLNSAFGVPAVGNIDIGNIDRAAVHVQAEHIAKTGLNAFAAVAVSPNNSGEAYQFADGSKIGLIGTIYDQNRWGKAMYTGLSYDFPRMSKLIGSQTLGYEFFLTDKQYSGVYSAADDITSRLETMGLSHKVYYTLPVTDDIKFHLSYTYLRERYSNKVFEYYVPNLTGRNFNSISRAGRTLEMIQLSFMVNF